eukprot:6805-Heterococcus_DN1.PRE.2
MQNKALLKRLEGLQAKCDALKQTEIRAEVEASVRSSLVQLVEVKAPSSSVEAAPAAAVKPTVSATACWCMHLGTSSFDCSSIAAQSLTRLCGRVRVDAAVPVAKPAATAAAAPAPAPAAVVPHKAATPTTATTAASSTTTAATAAINSVAHRLESMLSSERRKSILGGASTSSNGNTRGAEAVALAERCALLAPGLSPEQENLVADLESLMLLQAEEATIMNAKMKAAAATSEQQKAAVTAANKESALLRTTIAELQQQNSRIQLYERCIACTRCSIIAGKTALCSATLQPAVPALNISNEQQQYLLLARSSVTAAKVVTRKLSSTAATAAQRPSLQQPLANTAPLLRQLDELKSDLAASDAARRAAARAADAATLDLQQARIECNVYRTRHSEAAHELALAIADLEATDDAAPPSAAVAAATATLRGVGLAATAAAQKEAALTAEVAKLREELAAALQELDETSQYVRALEERLESLGYEPVGMASIGSSDSLAAASGGVEETFALVLLLFCLLLNGVVHVIRLLHYAMRVAHTYVKSTANEQAAVEQFSTAELTAKDRGRRTTATSMYSHSNSSSSCRGQGYSQSTTNSSAASYCYYHYCTAE